MKTYIVKVEEWNKTGLLIIIGEREGSRWEFTFKNFKDNLQKIKKRLEDKAYTSNNIRSISDFRNHLGKPLKILATFDQLPPVEEIKSTYPELFI
jgi:hypothetical protein